jgi:hypothetical protein
MGCGFKPGWCSKNAALENTCAWHDGLFQILTHGCVDIKNVDKRINPDT